MLYLNTREWELSFDRELLLYVPCLGLGGAELFGPSEL